MCEPEGQPFLPTDNNRSLMILGAGVMQIPLIAEAHALGLKVLCVDGNAQAPGRPWADFFIQADLKDSSALVEAARQGESRWGVSGVLTAGTDFTAGVAAVAEDRRWPGISRESALKASRKNRMRRAFQQHRIPSPDYCSFPREERPAIPFGFPRVVKPADNMGARGIRRVDSEEEMEHALKLAGQYAREGILVVEEYIPGPEFSLDALIYQVPGEEPRIYPLGLADRHIILEPYFIEMGHTLPSKAPREQQAAMSELLRQGALALGITSGMVKGDIKWTDQGPVLCEMAARLSGGYMSGWTYPGASGRSSLQAALLLALGENPLPSLEHTPDRGWTAAERAYISVPGTPAQIEGIQESTSWASFMGAENPAGGMEGQCYHYGRSAPGAPLVFPRNNVEKGGNFIVLHPDRDRACRDAQRRAAEQLIRLEPGGKETALFLLGPREWPPPALSLAHPENYEPLRERGLWDETLLPPGKDQPWEDGPSWTLPLPQEEEARDWHGEGWPEVLSRIKRLAGGSLPAEPLFWRSLIRGSLQGGLWYLDSRRRLDGQSWKELLRWN